jgi:CBS domain-containing protein
MIVRDLCICNAGACSPETSLARAGSLMRRYAVGSLPVVDRDDRVIGIVTDRDLFLELARRNAPPSEILVEGAMTDRPAVCSAQDDLQDCLIIMKRNRVRRLPVVDENDRLEGIISIDDIICHVADQKDDEEIPQDLLIDTLCEISRAYQAESGHRGLARELEMNGGRPRSHRDRSRGETLEPEGSGSRPRRGRTETESERRTRVPRSRQM